MSQPQLWKVTYEDRKGGYRLDCYTDTVVFDPSGGKNPQLVAIRFGGEPEKVRGLADAIYGGGTVEVEPDLKLDSPLKQCQRQLSHDGIYAEATLFLRDSDPETAEQERSPQKQTRLEGPPRKCYIFCPQGDMGRLFSEIDKRTGVPLIPDFQDYLLAELQARGILRKLEVISRTERLDAWLLTCTKDDKNIIQVVEDGLKSGKITIPGSTPENATAFQDIQTVTGYLRKFGANIAQRIKGQFVPLFDPASEALSQSVLTVNENIRQKAGYPLYDAQLAAAEGLKRKLDQHEPALLVAECGVGKTKIGLTALTASHLAAGKKKTFNVVLCPSHITEKWVREVEETVPDAFAGIVTSIRELKKLYRAYEKGDRTAYAILSKERARDGYMRAPAVRWSARKKVFLCPCCHQPIMEEISEGGARYEVPAEPDFFLRENTKNHKCRECGTVLWEPFCKPEQSFYGIAPASRCNEWVKIGGFGFVHRDFLWTYGAKTRSPQVLEALQELSKNPERFDNPSYGCRRFPISSFIKRKMKGKIDGLLADELHQYSQDSGQGDAMAEIAGTAKKVVGMTATLINGYASGIFHLLFRLTPADMVADGQEHTDPQRFCREYGVVESTYEVRAAEYNANRRASRTKKGERMLPGVSPLVYSRFLLQNTVFLSLMDMGKDLPEYEEIPVGLIMHPEVKKEYQSLSEQFLSLLRSERGAARKLLSAYLNTLTVYPDQPYGIEPVTDRDGKVLVTPKDASQPRELHSKDHKALELVRQKVAAGEKVLIYTRWVRIDTQEKLLRELTEQGYRAAVLPSNIKPIKRESWIEKQLANGLEVLICNPSLIETGLDANAFTTLVFYNMGYNLFTLRQASRRSWRINQTAPRVEVYFFYYRDTIQERAMQLMASKLAVAGIIEGNITDEGLAAMSNCQDMTSQLAKELALGIKSEVEDIGAVFKKMAFLHPQGEVRQTPPAQKPELQKSPVILLPAAKQVPEPSQPPAFITYSQMVRRRKKAPAAPDENQLSFFEQIPA